MKLVTAIMPTRGRNRNVWAAIALDSFLRQTYPNKHLLILDDADDPTFAEPMMFENVAYLQSIDRLPIHTKRNMLASVAAGEIICHFDSDDYSDPDRMAQQVKLLEESGKQVTGYHSMLFHDVPRNLAFKFIYGPEYAVGTSLCYRKEFWKAHPFRQGERPNVGEDNEFGKDARQRREIFTVDGGQMMVARIHAGNTDTKDTSSYAYRPVPLTAIPEQFFR